MSKLRQHLEMPSRGFWRSWLESNHDTSLGVWLRLQKGGGGLTYDEAVEEALCFGWIDGKVRRIDDEYYVRSFTPRKPRGNWSKLNKERVARLKGQGLMTEAGLQAIKIAKRDGSWTSLDAVEALEVPDDLASALAADHEAQRNFSAFPASARKAYLYWVISAKRPATRAKRVIDVVGLAKQNKKSRYDRPR